MNLYCENFAHWRHTKSSPSELLLTIPRINTDIMPPKRTPTFEEVEEIKQLLDFFTKELSVVSLPIRKQISGSSGGSCRWPGAIHQDEQCWHVGLQMKPLTYARAVTMVNRGEQGELDAHFLNTIYSMNLYPTTTRLTRVTSHYATVLFMILTKYDKNCPFQKEVKV